MAFCQRVFSILCVEFYRGSVDRSCEEILEKPVNRIASKTSRRYQIDSRIGIRNANPSSLGPSSRRARLEPRIDGDLSEYFRETRLADVPRLLIYSTSRDVYEWARYKFLDGRRPRLRGHGRGPREWFSIVGNHWRIASRFVIGISWLFRNVTQSGTLGAFSSSGWNFR